MLTYFIICTLKGPIPSINEYLDDVKPDVVLLQETWLLDSNICRLGNVHTEYMYCGVSGIDSCQQILPGRPSGGVAILWNKHISRNIKQIESQNRRIKCLSMYIDNIAEVAIVCVYFPCYNYRVNVVNTEFLETLDAVEQIVCLNKYAGIIVAGDWNTSLERNNAQTNTFKEFVSRYNLKLCWEHASSLPGDTYVNESLGHSSQIDHFVVSDNIFQIITKCNVIDSPLNPSMHRPVELTLRCQIGVTSHVDKDETCTMEIQWSQVQEEHINKYQLTLNNMLENCVILKDAAKCSDVHCKSESHINDINKCCSFLINSCLAAGNVSFPTKSSNKKKTVPCWTEEMKYLKHESVFWHTLWRTHGKPSSGELAKNMRSSRTQYHAAVRQLKKHETSNRRSRFAESICHRDSKRFWKDVRNMTSTKSLCTTVLDDTSNDEDICEIFRDKYQTVYNSFPTSLTVLNTLNSRLKDEVGKQECQKASVNDITKLITKLNRGKSDGYNGTKSEHYIFSSHRFCIHVSLLFQCMLTHGLMPEDLARSVIVSIPKDKRKSLSESGNYHGIVLCDALAKLFDMWILMNFSNLLISSDQQFAFKAGHSTSLCTSMLKETV